MRAGQREPDVGTADRPRLTRNQFFKAAGGAAGLLVVAPAAYAAAPPAHGALSAQGPFRSRPDLRPPKLTMTGAPTRGEGPFFLSPSATGASQAGPMIVDTRGQPVWFSPVAARGWAANFRVQRYRGKPVLTWWEGSVVPPGYGQGEGVIMDSSYTEVARVRAGNGRQADLHEFTLTPQGTALITCFPATVQADLTAVGGSRKGLVSESIIQEIDVASGRVLLEWRSLEHVAMSESYLLPPQSGVWDYMHANSVTLTPDGHLLVSARHTFALYKLDRRTGRMIWRLGGKRSNFAMGRGARFAWQHDARLWPGGKLTVFDDGAGWSATEPQSRGLVLHVDGARRTVKLAHAYVRQRRTRTSAMGSTQALPDGHVIVGFGLIPVISEFAGNGRVIAELHLPWGSNSYRGYRFAWQGTPAAAPDLAASVDSDTSTLYASWNGATGVSRWQVSLGPSATALAAAGTVPRSGFETAIPVATPTGYAAVTALDASGQPLATSAPVQL